MEIISATDHRQSVITLLSAENLPTDDLPQTLENFLACLNDGIVTSVVGVEIYGNYGLLRSLVVKPALRSIGIADKLIKQLEIRANSKALKAIYLLTETAPDYFAGKGYEKINRNDVPAEIQQSSEFSHVCPQSAILMKKELIK